MIGTNKLTLNQATACAAFQCWLNGQIFQDNLTVVAVAFGDLPGVFEIEFSPEDAK
jgi:hypothetical protein